MTDEDRIDAWARERAAAEVPDGFADDVMAATSSNGSGAAILEVMAVAAAGVFGVLRIAAAFAFLITPPGGPS